MKLGKCKVMGLTGGIASGKSLAVKEFKNLGAEIIDSDKISREIVKPGSKSWKKIVKMFGKNVLFKDRSINREILGRIIFQNAKKRKELEKIMHPEIILKIKKEINSLRKKQPGGIILVDAPLLFEAGIENLFDKIIVVWCPQEKQLERLKMRDKLQIFEIVNRLKSQMPLEVKKKKADFVIDNSVDNPLNLRNRVQELWARINAY